MRMLLLYILFALLGQQTTVNGQQTPFIESEKSVNISEICGDEKTNHKLVQKKSEKGSEPRAMSNEQKSPNAQGSQLEAQCLKKTVDYYESQIRLADSLYKNYLPQYNFDEVKKAVEFFDSLRLTTDNSQQTTDSSDSEKRLKAKDKSLKISVAEPVEAPNDGIVPSTSSGTAYRMSVDRCPLSVDIEYQRTRAHYYHAVGLTERDDIVGACEHYFIALEIMESETKNLKTSKSEKGLKYKRERRKVSVAEPVEAPNDGIVPSTSSGTATSRTVDRCPLTVDNPEDYEKIRFLSLIYTRLGELFYNESYCHLSIIKYKKALNYVEMLNNNKSKSQIYKLLGNSYQLSNMPDTALYYYNKSIETNSDLINKLDVDKSIALILFNNGARDSAFTLTKSNLCKIENIYVRDSYYTAIGGMFYNEHKYDSAIYYLEKSVKSNNNYIKHQSSSILLAIYDSIGNHEKKTYYEKIVLGLSMNMINKSVTRGELQYIYDNYKKRQIEKERLENLRENKLYVSVFIILVSLTIVIIILTWHESKRKDKYIASKEEIISNTNEEIKQKESEIKKLIEAIERYRTDINSLRNEMVVKEQEISGKESVIKNMEDDLSAKERELKRLQENVHENMILINNLNEDNIAKKKQIKSHLEEIENNRQVINDKDRLISIAAEGLITRKDAIAENRNEIARLQAIIGENDMIINRMSKDYKTNEELIAIQTEKIEKLKTEINETRNNLDDLRFRSSSTEGRIKSLNAELKRKEELIKKFTAEISNLRYRLERNHIDISNLNNYLQSVVCTRILKEIKELSEKKLKSYALSPLSKEEFVLLLNSANHHLNYFINDMANKYPKLKKEDMYYLCLVIMGLDNNQISSLFGVTYDTAKKREKKIRVIFGLGLKENLQNHLLHLI